MGQGMRRPLVVTALGVVQTLGWGTSFYLPAVLAPAIVADTGWSLGAVIGSVSLGLLTAGLVSPRVGRIIQAEGGRRVLTFSSIAFAAGLAVIGVAPSLPIYLIGWLLIGLAMGAGLYDAVFATLARLYGQKARSAIATVTLFGGMAGTVCWPLTAFMVQAVGWRGACLIYAAVHLLFALPLQALVLARAADTGAVSTSSDSQAQAAATVPHERALMLLLGFILTIIAGIGSIFVVHLLLFLQARGIDYTQAVAIGILFGPAQVGARVVERLFGERYHPIWTLAAAVLLMAIGLALLGATPVLAFGVVVYAAGYGISWIARGTVPLAMFGAHRFPRIMGRLALPSLTGQALAPALGAWWIEQRGVEETLMIVAAAALLNVVLMAGLWLRWRNP